MVAYRCSLCTEPAVEGHSYCIRHLKVPHTRRPPRPYHGRHAPRGPRFAPTNTKEWFALSKSFLADNPFCVRCRLKKRTAMAKVSDHVVPARLLHEKSPRLVFDMGQLQPLCVRCHATKTMHERRGRAWDYRTDPPTCIILPPKPRT